MSQRGCGLSDLSWPNAVDRHSFVSPSFPLRLKGVVDAGQFRAPAHCQIHVGEDDWQSNPANLQALGHATGMPVSVVPGGGHDLGKNYVGAILNRWLKS
jgi:hypothetical protein